MIKSVAKLIGVYFLLGSVSSFKFSNSRLSSSLLRSTEKGTEESEGPVIDLEALSRESAAEAFETIPTRSGPGNVKEPVAPRQAEWFPLLLAPEYLDGSLAGDVGFDPLGLASRPGLIYWMREAEVKHARLAMLGAVGWPLSELNHNKIADALGWDNILVGGERAPSVLNGGLNNIWIYSAFAFAILLGGILETAALKTGTPLTWEPARRPENYKPGDFKFDPLRLYGARTAFYLERVMENLTREEKVQRAKFDMELAEIKNGRLAMIAVVGFVVQELVFGSAVVEQTPAFFGDPLQ